MWFAIRNVINYAAGMLAGLAIGVAAADGQFTWWPVVIVFMTSMGSAFASLLITYKEA